MRFEAGSLPFGVAPAILKDCAEQLRHSQESFSLDEFCKALGAPRSEALPVLTRLVDAGIVLAHGDSLGYGPTERLQQLALASVGPGLQRKDAEALLGRVIAKAEQINAKPEEFLCNVVCLGVFGSYLTDKDVLGDLDIAVEIAEPRLPVDPTRKPDVMKAIEQSRSATNKTFAALRLRKPNLISIHTLEEVKHLGTPYTIVFGTPS